MKDYFNFAVKTLRQRKIRSWLTILGVIIGIGSVVGLISISNGMENAILEQFETMGVNTIIVAPKSFQGPGSGIDTSLTDDDTDVLRGISEIRYVVPIYMKNAASVEYRDETVYVGVMGYDTSRDAENIFDDMDLSMEAGRTFTSKEQYVVILGSSFAEKAFDKELRVKNRIYINDQKFEVIGIFDRVGNEQDDSSLFIPFETAREVFDAEGDVTVIMMQAKEGANLDRLADKITDRLEDKRGNEEFEVITPAQIVEQINNILGIITLLLVGIAGISLLVGAIGIMNTMYTSVLERTKDIGIMKAIGATNNAILSIFMIESAIIGLVGGVIGITVGLGMAFAVGAASDSIALGIPLKVQIDPVLIIGSLLFAVVLGIVSGALPARKASKLKPVDALRYE